MYERKKGGFRLRRAKVRNRRVLLSCKEQASDFPFHIFRLSGPVSPVAGPTSPVYFEHLILKGLHIRETFPTIAESS